MEAGREVGPIEHNFHVALIGYYYGKCMGYILIHITRIPRF